jgi:small subunit ribosomal protein S4
MGDPRRHRKKYSTPMHPWQKSRIEEEKEISKTYGTKNKKEIWKMDAVIKKFAKEAKALADLKDEEKEKISAEVLRKAKKLGLIKEEQDFDDILGLELKDVMERRLQTLVFKRGLSLSINQARQFITHEHILVGNKKITSPSYIVSVAEEGQINFAHDSPFCHPDHPERSKAEEKQKMPASEEKKKKEPKKKKFTRKKATPKTKEKSKKTVSEAPKEKAAEAPQE